MTHKYPTLNIINVATTPTCAMINPKRRKTIIPQIESTVGVKTPSKVPSSELSELELLDFATVDLRRLLRLLLLLVSSMVAPEWTVGNAGLAILGLPRRRLSDGT
jgi:hypothetical protein